MRKSLLASIVVLSATAVASSGHAASVQPVAGIYSQSIYKTAATASGGATCNKAGSFSSDFFTYPGPLKAGAANRGETGGGGIFVTLFPTMPGTGATTWSGTASVTDYPSGSTYTTSFSYSLTYVDSSSWIASGTLVEPGLNGQGTCTYTVGQNFIRTGK